MMVLLAEIKKAGSKTQWYVWKANGRLIVTKGNSVTNFLEMDKAPKYIQNFIASQDIDTLVEQHVTVEL